MVSYSSDFLPPIEAVEKPNFYFEKKAMNECLWPCAGLDEVGRGSLAGPVVAAAVVLDPDNIPSGLDDSKRLSTTQRDALFNEILNKALGVAVASVSADSIDRSDIRKASMEAMRRAFTGLPLVAKSALADGHDVPPDLACICKALVRGDQRSQSIAAASIVAKITRDLMMTVCGVNDNRYGFEVHMGYATARHRAAITEHGFSARIHRVSFAPRKD